MPTARGFLSSAVVNDIIYAIGGGYPTPQIKLKLMILLRILGQLKQICLVHGLMVRAAVVNGIDLYYRR